MAIIDIDSGHPLVLREYPRICVFMIPVKGEGGLFASSISKLCPGKLDMGETREMGSLRTWRYDGRTLYAVVAHDDKGYDQAPDEVRKALNTVAKLHVGERASFVMNAVDVPTPDRLKIMRELARSALQIHVFEFKF